MLRTIVSGLLCLTATLSAADWDAKAAATYVEARTSWWTTWPSAQRDQGTFCIACHAGTPYVLARPAIRQATGETALNAVDTALIANVTKRVRQWKEVAPAYPDKPTDTNKTAESRGTEAILNALVLSAYNSPDTKLAFENLWELQIPSGENKGSWEWLQFHYAPWEGDAQFFGATLAALAISNMPAEYRDQPEVKTHIALLRDYLLRTKNAQMPMDRVMLVWASAKLPGILTRAQQIAILEEAFSKQQADGGLSLGSLFPGWKRKDKSDIESKSDGYATAVVAYAAQLAGVPKTEKRVQLALNWLKNNQEKSDGRWLAYSMNKQRDLTSDIGRFMADAATAYALLALTER